MTTRRGFIKTVSGGLLGAAFTPLCSFAEETGNKARISACDLSLGMTTPAAFELAKQAGLDGVEVSDFPAGDKMMLSGEKRKEYQEAAAKTGLVISSLALGFMNGKPLASEADALQWVRETIASATELGAKVILVPFFGKADLLGPSGLKTAEVDATIEKLKALAPDAEKAGVILGLENYLSAKDNLSILERVKSNAVRVYFDIRNSTDKQYDVASEIRLLGDRMCQIHFKDSPNYLGEGKVAMQPVAEALKATKYAGWITLETSAPSKDRAADFKRNTEYVRKLMA